MGQISQTLARLKLLLDLVDAKYDLFTLTTASFTSAMSSKLAALDANFKGMYDDATSLAADYSTPTDGWYAWVAETATMWTASSGSWVDSTVASFGDMLRATYDPQGIGGDAFLRTNHTGTQAISTITGLQDLLDTIPSTFTGASSSEAGAAGTVPAPSAGSQDKVLKGNGAWEYPKLLGPGSAAYVGAYSDGFVPVTDVAYNLGSDLKRFNIVKAATLSNPSGTLDIEATGGDAHVRIRGGGPRWRPRNRLRGRV